LSNSIDKEMFLEEIENIDSLCIDKPSKALDVINKFLIDINLNNDVEVYIKAKYLQGVSYENLGEFESAIKVSAELIDIANIYSNNLAKSRAYIILGNTFFDLGNMDKALEYYLNCESRNVIIEDKRLRAALLNNIGEVYMQLSLFEKALGYYKKSSTLFLEVDYVIGYASTHVNIGACYLELNNYNLAEQYLEDAYPIYESSGETRGLSYYYHVFAHLDFLTERFSDSLKYYQKSLQLSILNGDVMLILENYSNMIDIFLSKKKYHLALNNSLEFLKKSKEHNHLLYISKAYEKLSLVYENTCNCIKALQCSRMSLEFNQLCGKENIANINKLSEVNNDLAHKRNEDEIYYLKNVELKSKNEELERSNKNIRLISEAGQKIISTFNLNDVLDQTSDSLHMLVSVESFGVALYYQESYEMIYRLLPINESATYNKEFCINENNCILSECIKNNRVLHFNNLSKQVNISEYKDINIEMFKGVESAICNPLCYLDKVIGILTVQSSKKNAFSQVDVDLIKALGSYIAIAIKNSEESKELELQIAKYRNESKSLEELNKKLEELSYIDALTRVFNRRKANEFLKYEFERAKRQSQLLSVLLIDVDYYKGYNDFYGHIDGDRCLRKIANILKDSLKRKVDFIARYGGDEFIIVLSEISESQAISLAQLMCKNVELSSIAHQMSDFGVVTVTIGGVCSIPQESNNVQSLIEKADKALYKAKDNGRNCVYF